MLPDVILSTTLPQPRPDELNRLLNLPSRIAYVGDSLPHGMTDNAVIAINHQADNLILLGAKMAQVLHQSLAIPFCPVPGDGRKNLLHTPQLPPGGIRGGVFLSSTFSLLSFTLLCLEMSTFSQEMSTSGGKM